MRGEGFGIEYGNLGILVTVPAVLQLRMYNPQEVEVVGRTKALQVPIYVGVLPTQLHKPWVNCESHCYVKPFSCL